MTALKIVSYGPSGPSGASLAPLPWTLLTSPPPSQDTARCIRSCSRTHHACPPIDKSSFTSTCSQSKGLRDRPAAARNRRQKLTRLAGMTQICRDYTTCSPRVPNEDPPHTIPPLSVEFLPLSSILSSQSLSLPLSAVPTSPPQAQSLSHLPLSAVSVVLSFIFLEPPLLLLQYIGEF